MRGIREIQHGYWPGIGLFVAALAEFRRAVVTARRDEHLKRVDVTTLAGHGTPPGDISQRIFEELYLSGRTSGSSPHRHGLPLC